MNHDTGNNPEFFMMGMGRSGTSLTEAIINAGEQMWLSPECWWPPDLIRGREKFLALFDPASGQRWDRAARAMNAGLLAPCPSRFGLQTIGFENAMHAREIMELYPAKVLHMVRDPRDTLASTLRTGCFSSPDGFFKAHAAIRKAARHGYMALAYEDLMADPETAVRGLCEFLEIDYSPKMLEPLARPISRCETPLYSAPGDHRPNPAVFGKWKHALVPEDLVDLNVHAPALKDLGYEVFQGRARLKITARDAMRAELAGMTVDGKSSVALTPGENNFTVDILSAGAVAVRLDGPEAAALFVGADLAPGGVMEPSPVKRGMFILDLAGLDGSGRDGSRFKTFHGLIRDGLLSPVTRLGLYSAGGATRAFVREFDRLGLNRDHDISVVMDRDKRGWLGNAPIVPMEEADLTALDMILVTSLPHYKDIAKALAARGLEEHRDFAGVVLPNQKLLKWW